MRKLNALILVFLLCYFIIQVSFPLKYTFNADEGTHALIGLFYKDLLLNIGNFKSFSDITDFSVNYIIKYPKLSAHYPPLYHWILSILFFISESFLVIRIFNVILTILTAYVVYKLCLKLSKNKEIAIISILFFLSFSIIFFYADKIMMDNLQILTFSLGLIYYFNLKEKKKIKKSNMLILGIIFSLSFLTKFFSLFLPIIILADALFTKRSMLKYIIISGLISVLLISPYAYFYIKFGFYKLAFNVASTKQIANIGIDFSNMFNFFGFDYLNFHGLSKFDYFNFFKIFGLSTGLLVAVSTIWYVWKNKNYYFILCWVFLPLVLFLFLFTDVELRFLYILMPIFALSCGNFIYNLLKRRKFRKIVIILTFLILTSQIGINIYIKLKEPFHPVEEIIRENIKDDGNILITEEMPLDKGAYSSVYIAYGRINEVPGNFIRPCILDNNGLSKWIIEDMGIKYLIDQNETIENEMYSLLNLKLLDEKDGIRIFEVNGVVNKIDCNYVCVLKKKICKGESISNILTD